MLRPETTNVFEEDIGEKLLAIGLDDDSLDVIPKAQWTKQKQTNVIASN